MNKTIALTACTAATAALAVTAAKPLALLGLGSLILSVWVTTFRDTLASEVFPDRTGV